MKNWQIVPFADVVYILDSRRVPINRPERSKRQVSITYYGTTGQTGGIDDFIFDEELALLGEDGAPFLDFGKAKEYLIRGKSWVNNHAHVLRAKPGLLNSYLIYQRNNLDYRFYVSCTTSLELPQGPMKQILLLVSPEDDQRRIMAEIEKQFTRLDARVAALPWVHANPNRDSSAVLAAACEGRNVTTEAEIARQITRSNHLRQSSLTAAFSGDL
jgi:type I restriction enzyme S subunit